MKLPIFDAIAHPAGVIAAFNAARLMALAMLCNFFGVKSQKGVTMIEYALIAALVAVVVIAALATVGGKLTNLFNKVANNIK
ncbi:MAG TPA: Flp family type IVb pilin [Chlorobaculum sp.]|nr:Flp family type IVb pilin [Chlorobaculum sp.]